MGDQDKHYYSIRIVALTDRIPVEPSIQTDKLITGSERLNTVTQESLPLLWLINSGDPCITVAINLVIKLLHSEPGYRILGGDDRIGSDC